MHKSNGPPDLVIRAPSLTLPSWSAHITNGHKQARNRSFGLHHGRSTLDLLSYLRTSPPSDAGESPCSVSCAVDAHIAKSLVQILEKEKPDAILPTMGGQTGLNIAKELAESGVLERLGIELIGAKLPSIDRAEDRDLFKKVLRCLEKQT